MSQYNKVRPWGKFEVLLDEIGYKVKRIIVEPGQKLSYQYHNHREEYWVCVQGFGVLTLDDREFDFKLGQTVYIKLKQKHRIHNTGNTQLVFIETQLGEKCEEDDIVRIQDDYQRN
jgi:mannose-6-phosphate isomerase